MNGQVKALSIRISIDCCINMFLSIKSVLLNTIFELKHLSLHHTNIHIFKCYDNKSLKWSESYL